MYADYIERSVKSPNMICKEVLMAIIDILKMTHIDILIDNMLILVSILSLRLSYLSSLIG